jgi:hypothetical protein
MQFAIPFNYYYVLSVCFLGGEPQIAADGSEVWLQNAGLFGSFSNYCHYCSVDGHE